MLARVKGMIVLNVVAATGCSSLLGIEDPTAAAGGGWCVGDGPVRACLDQPPTLPFDLVGSLEFDTSSASCTVISSDIDELCLLAHTSISIPRDVTLRAIGPRPLVLASASSIRIEGTMDVASARDQEPGAGASPVSAALCEPSTAASGPGGGAGGSFGGRGGAGASGRGTSSRGGVSGPVAALDRIRGGCPGGIAGGGVLASSASGGGAIYMIASEEIVVNGTINASGAGGDAGRRTGAMGGGYGGGSGGQIGLEAPSIGGVGSLFANGGGGGGGVGDYIGGSGRESQAATVPGSGGAGGGDLSGGTGGRGGDGSQVSLDGESGSRPTAQAEGGGGGGGGGAGIIYVHGTSRISGAISPPVRQM